MEFFCQIGMFRFGKLYLCSKIKFVFYFHHQFKQITYKSTENQKATTRIFVACSTKLFFSSNFVTYLFFRETRVGLVIGQTYFLRARALPKNRTCQSPDQSPTTGSSSLLSVSFHGIYVSKMSFGLRPPHVD